MAVVSDRVIWVRDKSEGWVDLRDLDIYPFVPWLITYRALYSEGRTPKWQLMFNDTLLHTLPKDCVFDKSSMTEQDLRSYYKTMYLIARGEER